MLMVSLLLLVLAMTVAAAPSAELYVAPNGNDNWSGTLPEPNAAGTDGPFATFARAQQAVRRLRGQAEPRPITVLFRGGVYTLSAPIRLTPEDSGSEGAPITYAAYPGEKPVFTGGVPITGWRKGEGELWITEVPGVKEGQWYFHQLFVDGQRRTRARTPNEGYLRIAGPLEPLRDREAARRNPATKQGFKFKPGDLKKWDELDDVTLVLYHAWTASLHWIKELDEAAGTVRFTAPCGWPVAWWEGNQRYYVENFREALDSPGEWYLSRKTGILTYWPMPGEDLTKAQVIAPRLQHLLEIAGDAQLGLPVAHITFRGLSFQYADWQHDRNKPADGQAATHLTAAFVATGARDCTFENCELAHLGEYALILGNGCKRNRVVHCEIHDLGGGGVRIGETTLPPDPEAQASHNIVDNCFIHDGGHVFRAGIGVWIGRSSYNTVSHNEICDFYYSGCSVGWSWGYAPTTAHHNVFEYNHIHDIGKGVLSDMGGIYSLGVSPGTVERFNLIHDVYSYSYGGWGLYTDEGSTDILLENNVVYNTKTGGFHQHYGQNNVIRNNIFGFSMESNIISARSDVPNSLTFERNIVVTNNGLPLGGQLQKPNFTLRNNLYWDAAGNELEFLGHSFEEWQKLGKDEGSLIADPHFVDIAHHDFRFADDSNARKIGFVPFDISRAGLYGEPEWVQAPAKIVRPPVVVPVQEPQRVDDDFEDTEVGAPPAGASVSVSGEGKVAVTGEQAASGTHSLKFTDAPGQTYEWQPHIYYRPRMTKGVARFSFDVRLEPGAVLWQEWRDAANPYRPGPSLRIEKTGEVKVGGRVLTTVPLSRWVHLEMTCPLGKNADGTWTLAVSVGGAPAQVFDKLPLANPQFRTLQWLGFMSMATDKAVLYVDNLKLEAVGR
jgi:parallel beta-helix repeat protein